MNSSGPTPTWMEIKQCLDKFLTPGLWVNAYPQIEVRCTGGKSPVSPSCQIPDEKEVLQIKIKEEKIAQEFIN